MTSDNEQMVEIAAGHVLIEGVLTLPAGAGGLVIFAHGSGSGRHSPRNQRVARMLEGAGLGTLLIDLLTADEERAERHTGHLRFDIDLLARRLIAATDWAAGLGEPAPRVGYFGASTGGGAALVAAARRTQQVKAVVSRGGRPDLAGSALAAVRAPTLLIVGGNDPMVLGLNREALAQLGSMEKQMVVVPGATHLFEEPGALESVAGLAARWFTRYLGAPGARDGDDARAR
jgi:dienelactone hydrolase